MTWEPFILIMIYIYISNRSRMMNLTHAPDIQKIGNGPSTKYTIIYEGIELLTQLQMAMDVIKKQIMWYILSREYLVNIFRELWDWTLFVKCKTARYANTERLYIDFSYQIAPAWYKSDLEHLNYIILRALWQGRYFCTYFCCCDIATVTRKENDIWDN